jgi:L-lactate dehydrogenase complex protein LldF
LLALWRWLSTTPWMYRLALRVAAGVLRAFSVPGDRPGRRWLRRLPLALGGWSQVRDLPAPEGGTFQARWRRRRAMTDS